MKYVQNLDKFYILYLNVNYPDEDTLVLKAHECIPNHIEIKELLENIFCLLSILHKIAEADGHNTLYSYNQFHISLYNQ